MWHHYFQLQPKSCLCFSVLSCKNANYSWCQDQQVVHKNTTKMTSWCHPNDNRTERQRLRNLFLPTWNLFLILHIIRTSVLLALWHSLTPLWKYSVRFFGNRHEFVMPSNQQRFARRFPLVHKTAEEHECHQVPSKILRWSMSWRWFRGHAVWVEISRPPAKYRTTSCVII